ncbi:hypothetical protein RRG08_042575 [Elysia crispata]|uniref:Uncharacterized protein n=1 Tax=Elysia crispata TaxID=231223 RepID=A0AAE0XPV4_9GAST|nr:hypothetical protein RRG08_042575 [Elysia crispata]
MIVDYRLSKGVQARSAANLCPFCQAIRGAVCPGTRQAVEKTLRAHARDNRTSRGLAAVAVSPGAITATSQQLSWTSHGF